MSGAGLADLTGYERFEMLIPDERVMADLLPRRPELLGGGVHGQVVLRLQSGLSVVEYVECSARTAVSMLVCGTDQALVLRREHRVGRRIARAMSVAAAVFAAAMWVAMVAPDPVAWAAVAAGPLASWWVFGRSRRRQAARAAERVQWTLLPLVEWMTVLGTVGANPARVSAAALVRWADHRIGVAVRSTSRTRGF